MSEAKFTKGEWEWEHDQDTACTIRVFNSYDVNICRLESEDDAHLIAAAPEMYKDIEYEIKWLERLAKKYVIGSYELQGIQSRIERKAALLAKARGEKC